MPHQCQALIISETVCQVGGGGNICEYIYTVVSVQFFCKPKALLKKLLET